MTTATPTALTIWIATASFEDQTIYTAGDTKEAAEAALRAAQIEDFEERGYFLEEDLKTYLSMTVYETFEVPVHTLMKSG